MYKQTRARLRRWLDRLNHFDICSKHTAGKETKFTDFMSRNTTKNSEPEENYEEDLNIISRSKQRQTPEQHGFFTNQTALIRPMKQTRMIRAR